MTSHGGNAPRAAIDFVELRRAEMVKKQLNLPTLASSVVLMSWMKELKDLKIHNGAVYYTSRWNESGSFIIAAGVTDSDPQPEARMVQPGDEVGHQIACLHCRRSTGLAGDTLPADADWKLWGPPRLPERVAELHPLFLLCIHCALKISKEWRVVVEKLAPKLAAIRDDDEVADGG